MLASLFFCTLFVAVLCTSTSHAAAFVSSNQQYGNHKGVSHFHNVPRLGQATTMARVSFPRQQQRQQQVQELPLPMMPDSGMLDSASLWLATIDSDIANIPTNEFATVFAGGIVSFYFYFYFHPEQWNNHNNENTSLP
jgi:hypothetical protein